MTAYVIRWDCLPTFRETFPTIELPNGTGALGIETADGAATLLEAFAEDERGCFDQTLTITTEAAEALAAFADQYGDTCA